MLGCPYPSFFCIPSANFTDNFTISEALIWSEASMDGYKTILFDVNREREKPCVCCIGNGCPICLVYWVVCVVLLVCKLVITKYTFIPTRVDIFNYSGGVRSFIYEIPEKNHPILPGRGEFVHKFAEFVDASMNISDKNGAWGHTVL